MCRNIRPLFNYDPPTTPDDTHAAALQYVRKVSGYTKPSAANEVAFNQAVVEIAAATEKLLANLTTSAPPRDREREIELARAKNAQRFG